jgi:hypothetical protein
MSTITAQQPTGQPAHADPLPCDGQPPPASQEHQWLKRYVGEWTADLECSMGPGQPTMKTTGSTRDRLLGDFWVITEGKNDQFPYAFVYTLGYDVEKKKYVGTWIDTMSGHLWRHEGTVNAVGTTLTMETEGPSPMFPGKTFKFREVAEFKSDDHRVITSSMQGEDGQWHTCLVVNARRKK